MTRTNLGEIISKFLQGKRLVNFELIRPSFYAEHRAWFCIPKQNCQLYPEVEIGKIITWWDVAYAGSVSEVTDEWSIDQERRGGRLNLPGQNRRSTPEWRWNWHENHLRRYLQLICFRGDWGMKFSQGGKRRKIQWWRSGLSEITVNFDVRDLCIRGPRLTLSKLCFRRL